IPQRRDELEGRFRTIREVVRWTLWAVVVMVAVSIRGPFWHGLVVAVGGGILLGCVLRIYTAWALRRQPRMDKTDSLP
ncbi:hypothetical protein ACQ7B2_18075, partial [Escherichia coli]